MIKYARLYRQCRILIQTETTYKRIISTITVIIQKHAPHSDSHRLSDRREQLTKHFFDQLKRPDSCLAHLMPLRRDISLTSYLRNARLYELPK